MSYLHDVVTYGNDSLDSAEAGEETLASLHQRFHELMNSVKGVYSMLCNRRTMLELRAQLEVDPSSSQRGGTEALHAKLQVLEDCVCRSSDGVVADEVLQEWLNDFHRSRGKAMLSTTAKQAASAQSGNGRWKPRDDRHKSDKHECDRHDDKRDTVWNGRGTGGEPGTRAPVQRGMRVLPYMDDLLVLVDSHKDGLLQRDRVQRVLNRLGLQRTKKMGQWNPVQIIEHLGLEADLKHGQFHVTDQHVRKFYVRAKVILCDAARNRRLLSLLDLHDWRLNCDWFKWANAQWGPYC
ncbi:hypothetical protein CYMTET_45771 [Cymbomonas tetramitiformis]|uniref:Reverse transcriptase domain-containing protein n=1 Tax=Cymbomonas tetramitiformis TaxID=36881 RepID=A0AAE0BYQ6_9CHLO|nr:hypothetical protein CYMTET_45771 [Cymbomonas tetramitiformis]